MRDFIHLDEVMKPPPPKSMDDYGRPTKKSVEKPSPQPPPIIIKTAAAFAAEYVPLSYVIEPIVRTSSVYTVTARTGHGKTAFLVAVGLAVSTGRNDILGYDVIHGRVVYVACENADDVRMRIIAAAFALNIDLRDLGSMLTVIDVRRRPEEIIAAIRATENSGEFSLIIIDTLAALFDGNDINDNVQAGEFIRRLRPLTCLKGLPAVMVAAHPVKNATEEQLIPYGGGASLNELDGNLSLWKKQETGITNLHWCGKLRGLEFQPKTFRFDLVCSPDLLDAKGRSVQLPVIRPCEADDAERREGADIDRKITLLKTIRLNPNGSVRAWAESTGISTSAIGRILQSFGSDKLAEKDITGRWRLTPKGIKEVNSLL